MGFLAEAPGIDLLIKMLGSKIRVAPAGTELRLAILACVRRMPVGPKKSRRPCKSEPILHLVYAFLICLGQCAMRASRGSGVATSLSSGSVGERAMLYGA
jgi:hypothetical protein